MRAASRQSYRVISFEKYNAVYRNDIRHLTNTWKERETNNNNKKKTKY